MKEKLMLGMLISLMAFSFGVNILSNPGFETNSFQYTSNVFNTGITSSQWANTTETGRLNSNSTCHSGSYCMGILAWSAAANKGFEQIVAFTPGSYTRMDFKIWTKKISANAYKHAMYLRFLNSSKGVLSFYSVTFDPTSNWTQRSLVGASIPAGTAYVQAIVTTTTSGSQNTTFDDATLEPYTP